MSYFKDMQDDKELVFGGYDTLKDTLTMSAELILILQTILLKIKIYRLESLTLFQQKL